MLLYEWISEFGPVRIKIIQASSGIRAGFLFFGTIIQSLLGKSKIRL